MDHHVKRGWHFLQIPGPSNTPGPVLRSMSRPTIDHRGPEFSQLTKGILRRLKEIFLTDGDVLIYPSSGTGAWESALLNLFNPGDQLLAIETGHFAVLWRDIARKIGLEVNWISGDWRRGIDAQKVLDNLKADKLGKIKGVITVHNETSNGITSDIHGVRKAMDEVGHQALLLTDVVSSLGVSEFRQDEWGIDVAICASQKGFMMPPGLGFNVINKKALQQSLSSGFKHSYWNWERIIQFNRDGFFPYTPASNLLFGLDTAIDMILEEGLERCWARHNRLAEACRLAGQHWGLENQCIEPKLYSSSTTALRVPEGHDADRLRSVALDEFNLSLGKGLGQLQSKVFRIGHLGDINELMVVGTLAGVEMSLHKAGIPHHSGGINAAMSYLRT